MFLGDWGSAGYPGGTPMYAGPRTYEYSSKDLFSFGRLALELFLEPQGKMNTRTILRIEKLEPVDH